MAVLLATAEAGSLSAASRRLGMPLATVSRKISDLEAHLKTQLLRRSSRQVALTDAGRSYADYAKRILEQVDEAERTAAGEYTDARGDLTVTAPVVFGRLHLLPVIIAFLQTFPEIDLRLMLIDRPINLMDEHVDVALRIGHLPESGLIARRVGAIRRVVCASPAYLATHGMAVVPEDLAAHQCVVMDNGADPRVWRFRGGEHQDRGLSVRVRARLTVTTAEAAIAGAVAGLGITRVLSYQVAAAVAAGQLRVILQDAEPEPWPVNLVYAGHGFLPVKLRAFLDFAAPRLKARLADGDVARPTPGSAATVA